MKRLAMLAAALLMPFAALAAANYETTPMTQADMDLYLSIMRAAADHNSHLSAADQAALKYMQDIGKHPPQEPAGMPTQAQMQQMEKNAQLASRATQLIMYDDTIAQQRGVQAQYDGIKGVVEDLVMWGGPSGGADCGGGCGGDAHPTTGQLQLDRQMQATRKADWPLIQPHVAEIKQLKKKVSDLLANQ
jgi:hypothetical protein